MKIGKILSMFLFILIFSLTSCDKKDYSLNEDNFFLVMTNIQYYPDQYLESQIDLDCFTYELKDVNDNRYILGVRKCSAGYGCTCGKDTIIGFILNYKDEIPEPKNQSVDTVEKTWMHLSGKIASKEFTQITIHSYNEDGSINYDTNETISFLTFNVDSLELIEDYQNLKYYVTK